MSAKINNYLADTFNLNGKCAIVTGGGTGIGAAIAQGLALAGATVVLVGRRIGPLEDSCRQISQLLYDDDESGHVFYVPFDVTDTEKIPSFLSKVEETTGGLKPTILVNNAGVNVRQKAEDLTDDHWDLSLKLMLTAPSMLTRALADNFKEFGYGRVINIASLQTYQAFPDSLPYACAKSGTLGLTRALAEQYSPLHGYENVTCNAIAPGYVKTDLTAKVFADQERAQRLADATILGRNSDPEDLVGAAVFLAGNASKYITAQTIPVDGGFTALGLR